ncbi:MAG: hydroxyacid dehydrogenase [Anaerotignum sp.]|nr:hydroxyacid dehydrogenase [Anaerotignum sp.]MBR3910824.1 hydroxyacid dehydrogenase [Anaerotignum sp.]
MKIVIIEPLGITPEKLEEAVADVKARGHEIVAYDTKEEDPDKLAERGKDADIIIIANQPFRKNVIEKCENLKLLSVAFTGVDHIDVDFCKEKGITVCNAAGYSTNAVAELAFGLAISVLRNIPACDNVCRKEGTKAGLVGGELFGKTFGIVGTGAIGGKVAKIAQAFGCKVVAYSRTVKPEMEGLGIEYMSLEDVLKVSDIVSLHVPLNDKTKGLIGEKEIALMKKNAILLNTARGPVVDSEALAKALNEEKIAGAGIDVFEMEPPVPADHPLMHSKHTVVTPHVAFASHEALFTRAQIVSENILKWEDGVPQNVIC